MNLSMLDRAVWLADPAQVQLALARILRIPTCPTAREIAEHRRARLDEFRGVAARATPLRSGKGKVGVIPVHGPVDQRQNAMLAKLGGTSTEEVGAALDALLAEPSVSTIVLHVDSPGGTTGGIIELSRRIFAARGQKRTIAIADSMAGSAGFWIASAAETLVCTPGGSVGSIGCYMVHTDQAKQMEEEGVKVTVIRSGKYKAEGNPYEPLDAEARDEFQKSVDQWHTRFVDAVAKHRGVPASKVRSDYGKGRMLDADNALAAGMIDRVLSFDELLGKLAGSGGLAAGTRASVEVLRMRHEHRRRAWGTMPA